MPSSTGHAARAVLAVLLCAFAMTPATAADRADSATGWTARPAASGAATGTGDGRPYFYLEGVPGTVLQDRLAVTNPGRTPVTVRLRGADAYNAEDGEFAVRGSKGSAGTGVWLRLAADRVTVPARTRAEVPFSVTVPTSAPPGDHPGAIVAESGGRSVGVRVHLRVSGPTLAALTVEDVTVSGRTIHYTLVNRGNAALAPRLAVSADGVFGTLLRREAGPCRWSCCPDSGRSSPNRGGSSPPSTPSPSGCGSPPRAARTARRRARWSSSPGRR